MSQSSPVYDIDEIVVTTTAKSKAFRLYREYELRRRIKVLQGRIWRKGGPEADEFHLVSAGRSIVFTVEDGTIVVITQMHSHPNYRREAEYKEIKSHSFNIQIPW
jgi:hypothetical protein